MANQRKKGKKPIGAWVDEELKAKLKDIAVRDGVPLSDVVQWILRDQVEKYECEQGVPEREDTGRVEGSAKSNSES